MSLQRISVSSVVELLSAIEQHKEDVYVLFCGDVRQDTGESWCPDCVRAEPVVAIVFQNVTSGVFIRCSVGDRETWKHPENEFRVHPQTQITGVPTLVKWGKAQRLGPSDCADERLVRQLVEG